MKHADPFDPPGVSWQGVSLRLVWVRLAGAGLTAAVGVVATLLVARLTGQSFVLWALVPFAVVAVVALVVVPRQVRAWGYAEQDEELLVRHGLLFRVLVVVPYGRMQYVDVQAGPLDRLLGLAQVRLHTASASTDAAIPGLTGEQAERLRERLNSRGQAQLAGL